MGTLRAIDLYSGIGGWALGLTMAGFEVVGSYEWWPVANRTHNLNFGTDHAEVDIRTLDLSDLPGGIDVVVGSPPCTQFSYANRGGSGDIADGLKDVGKFLEIVEHLSPTAWVMENVPRVAGILERELLFGGALERFAPLVERIMVVDMSEWGLPQRRRRMLAGRFPADLFASYRRPEEVFALRDVVRSLGGRPPRDPLYGGPVEELTDHRLEAPLGWEEHRLNQDAKTHHPVYNIMAFPDRLNAPSRTVTATCTRVSRESIVVPRGQGAVRRLSVRERGSLQGFPATFRFYGTSYTDKLTMIGNAIPPPITYLLAHSILGTPASEVPPLSEAITRWRPPTDPVPDTPPPGVKLRYPIERRFRSAIPGLRFGSGMRFELTNSFKNGAVSWAVAFYYGTSKDIRTLPLDGRLLAQLEGLGMPTRIANLAEKRVRSVCDGIDPVLLQAVWTHRQETGPHPFGVVDALAAVADEIARATDQDLEETAGLVLQALMDEQPKAVRNGAIRKLLRNAPSILAGALVGSEFNLQSASL